MWKTSLKTSLSNLIILFFIIGCSNLGSSARKASLEEKSSLFNYQDASGSFLIRRQTKLEKGKLVLRGQLFLADDVNEPLEKTISISQIGRAGNNPAMKPLISQHTVWFDKKRYFVQHKVNDKTKSLESIMDSPEVKWQGKKSSRFPKGSVFCFYSQLPECLGFYGLLRVGDKKPHSFVLILDSFPYVLEQLQNMPNSVFIASRVNYEDEFSGLHRFTVDLGNQVISYQFNQDLVFEKMFWISQSISMIKQN